MARFGGASGARNVRMNQRRLGEEPTCRREQRIPNVEAERQERVTSPTVPTICLQQECAERRSVRGADVCDRQGGKHPTGLRQLRRSGQRSNDVDRAASNGETWRIAHYSHLLERGLVPDAEKPT